MATKKQTSAAAQEAELERLRAENAALRSAAAAAGPAAVPAAGVGLASSTIVAHPAAAGASSAGAGAGAPPLLADGAVVLAADLQRGRVPVPSNRRWMGTMAAVATAFLALASVGHLCVQEGFMFTFPLVWLSLVGTALLGHQTRWGREGGVLTRRSRDVGIALLVMAILGLIGVASVVALSVYMTDGWALMGVVPSLIGLPLAIATASGVVDTAPFRMPDDAMAPRLATEAASMVGATRWRGMQVASVLALALLVVVGTYEQIDLRWWTNLRFDYACRDYYQDWDDEGYVDSSECENGVCPVAEEMADDAEPTWAAYCRDRYIWEKPSDYPGNLGNDGMFYAAIFSIMPLAIIAGALTIAAVARRRLEIAVANIGVPALIFVALTQIAVLSTNSVQALVLRYDMQTWGYDAPIPDTSYYTVAIVRLALSTTFWMIVTSVMGHTAWTAFAAIDDMIDSGNGRRASEPQQTQITVVKV